MTLATGTGKKYPTSQAAHKIRWLRKLRSQCYRRGELPSASACRSESLVGSCRTSSRFANIQLASWLPIAGSRGDWTDPGGMPTAGGCPCGLGTGSGEGMGSVRGVNTGWMGTGWKSQWWYRGGGPHCAVSGPPPSQQGSTACWQPTHSAPIVAQLSAVFQEIPRKRLRTATPQGLMLDRRQSIRLARLSTAKPDPIG